MPPPPPRPPSARLSSSPPCSSKGASSQELSLVPLSAVTDLPIPKAATSLDLPQTTLQLRQHGPTGAEHLLVDASPLVPSSALASALELANPAAAAAAMPMTPGLPSETAAVAAASDALIATFNAAGTDTQPKAPAATAGSSINASATGSSEKPHMSPGAQTGAAPPDAPGLSQAQEQSKKSGVTSPVSENAQPEAAAEEAVTRQPGTSDQLGRAAAAASGPAQSSPAPRAVGDAGPPQDINYGSQGRAALAAMPKIGTVLDSDDEDVICVNTRYRPRTALPVRTQTKEQIELQQRVSQEVRRKWLEELQDAAKVQ